MSTTRIQGRSLAIFATIASFVVTGCGEIRPVWRDQTLPSGRVVKVTQCLLAWGVEHDERTPAADAFSLEFVYSNPEADAAAREQEVKEAFELIRPVSELWALNSASVAAFPTAVRKGHYDLWVFARDATGRWTSKHYPNKVFVND